MSEKIFGRSIKGFTLIELLIVVAIIAILAAIAVPNFLEAQVRAKVSRAKSDIRSMATAMEAYAVDNNCYPQCNNRAVAIAYGPDATPPDTSAAAVAPILERISTPIAYITSAKLKDPFLVKFRKSGATSAALCTAPTTALLAGDVVQKINSYLYQSVNSSGRAEVIATPQYKATAWFMFSVGPDSIYPNLGGVLANEASASDGPILLIYDPTNGTVSFGDVYRTGGSASGGGTYFAGSGLRQAIETSQR